MAIQPTLTTQWFLDPISGKPFRDPVMNHCGHSYNRVSLDHWRRKENQDICPLCRAPIQMLIQNLLLQQATGIALDPANVNFTEVRQLNNESREIIEREIQVIGQQRARDEVGHIPTKLSPYLTEKSASDRAAKAAAGAYFGGYAAYLGFTAGPVSFGLSSFLIGGGAPLVLAAAPAAIVGTVIAGSAMAAVACIKEAIE